MLVPGRLSALDVTSDLVVSSCNTWQRNRSVNRSMPSASGADTGRIRPESSCCRLKCLKRNTLKSAAWRCSRARDRSLALGAISASTAAGGEESDFYLSYELVQGTLVKWSVTGFTTTGVASAATPQPPTVVMIHGIMGSKRNLLSFAKRLAQAFPAWQFLLVDLRCHGQSAAQAAPGENTVGAAARDVLKLLGALKLFPHALVGHSFGGKVAMSMLAQFGRRLPRQAQVWVLDTVPGDVFAEGGDHPRDVINFVRTLPRTMPTRKALVDALTGRGFTLAGAQWMTTNLAPGADGALTWTFDIDGIAQMYASYEATDLWPLLEAPPQGASIDFIRAEQSAFLWAEEDLARMAACGARVHMLRNSGHWVHIDNPEGLVEIMQRSFGGEEAEGSGVSSGGAQAATL